MVKINQPVKPEMPEAIIGNSRLNASVRKNGEIYRLFWPRIDYGQHLGHFWAGIRVGNSSTKWFHLDEWSSSQCYLDNTNILETTLTGRSSQLKVTQRDFMLPAQDLLTRHYELENTGSNSEKISLFLYCHFEIEESVLYDGVYLDFTNHSLVFFRRDTYFAVTGRGCPLTGYQCGRRGASTDPYREATEGLLWGNRDSIRQGAGSLSWDLGEIRPGESKIFTLYLAAGHGEGEVQKLLSEATSRGGDQWLENTRRYWLDWLQQGARTRDGDFKHPAYNRSLLAMKLMTCGETGASIAAPEFDPFYLACGGYGYCWPRDAVFVAAALDEAGYTQLAANFYGFAASVQNRDGSWRQRYFLDGMPAPFWGEQIDQVGAVLWGYGHHYSLSRDRGFLEKIWSSLKAGAGYLIGQLAANGLPAPSFDPWEDEYLQGTYSAAAAFAGLKAASELAAIKGEKEPSRRWLEASRSVQEGILRHQWSGRLNRFRRGINRRVYRDTYDSFLGRGERAFTGTDPTGIYPNYFIGEDDRVDAALLGLVFPFAVIDPLDDRMEATVRAIEEKLWNPCTGGLHRYEGDCYRGGNPWLIATFWLSIYHLLAGNRARARDLYNWCLNQANQHLLLPEQADKNRGGPAWAMPLNWSHAMFILTHLALTGRLSILNNSSRKK